MEKIEQALWQDYEEAKSELKGLTVGSEEHKTVSEKVDCIRNELIKLEQIRAENKREKHRNWVTIGTTGVSVGVSLYGLHKTFKFDKVATVTSTLGRGILNGVGLRMFKR